MDFEPELETDCDEKDLNFKLPLSHFRPTSSEPGPPSADTVRTKSKPKKTGITREGKKAASLL